MTSTKQQLIEKRNKVVEQNIEDMKHLREKRELGEGLTQEEWNEWDRHMHKMYLALVPVEKEMFERGLMR